MRYHPASKLLIVSLLAALVAVAETPIDSAGGKDQPRQIETVIVVGERRDLPLLQSTSSVAIYDEKALAREIGQTVNEVLQSSANVLVRSLSEAPNIRGSEGGGPGGLAQTGLGGTQPRIPLVIDEIARPANLANADFNTLWDVNRIEVLKGTQTSLRGRSAIGGAVIVKTNGPTFTPEGAVEVMAEADGFHGTTYVVNGMASGGVIDDRLALRGSLEYRSGDDPRDIIDILPGQEDKVDALTEFEQLRFRGKALFLPGGDDGPWTVMGILEFQDGRTPQTRGTVLAENIEDREFMMGGGLRLFDTSAYTLGLDVSYDLGDLGTLRSITSVSVSEFESRDEQPIAPAPQNFFFDFEEDIFNQDVIWTLPNAWSVTGLAGASFSHRDQQFDLINEVPPLPSGSLSGETTGTQDTWSLFADLRIPISEQLTLLAGGRLLHDDLERDTFIGVLAFPSPPFPFTTPPTTQVFASDETVFLPMLGIQYQLTEHSTLALTAREGWNAGGASIQLFTGEPFTYDSEEVRTYEGSYRFVSADQKSVLGITAFYNQQDDTQYFLQLLPGALASTLIVNLPETESYGLELEASTTLADSLDLFLSLGVLETEIINAIPTRPDLEGNRVGRDPELTATIGFHWLPPAVKGLAVYGQASYVGEFFNDFNNFEDQKIGDYTLVDVGASFAVNAFEVRGFVNNLTDEAGVNALVSTVAEITLPRTYGVSVTTRF
ncbi:MAG: TonB-dependent receptor [Pseudomonadota bacterium]